MVLLVLDTFAGRYIIGAVQMYVAILCLLAVSFSLFYFGIKDRRLFRSSAPGVERRKRALLRLLRMTSRKRRIARKLIPG